MKAISNLISAIVKSKTYLAGASLMLLGLAHLLQDLAQVHGFMSLLAFVQALPNNPGVLELAGGLAAVGLRHSNDKSEAKILDSHAAAVAIVSEKSEAQGLAASPEAVSRAGQAGQPNQEDPQP